MTLETLPIESRTVTSLEVKDALDYAARYTGDFDFMLAMRARVEAGATFSPRQVQAILNSKRAQEKREDAARSKAITEIIEAPFGTLDLRSSCPPGKVRIAVTRPADGVVKFYQIDNVTKGSYAGNVFVREVHGPKTSHDPVGRQRPGELYKGRRNGDLAVALLDIDKAMADYGLLIGRCALCFKDLTVADSRKVGIGPKCLKRSTKRIAKLAVVDEEPSDDEESEDE